MLDSVVCWVVDVVVIIGLCFQMFFRTFASSNNQSRICMKNLHRLIWIFVLVLICNVSCRKDDLSPTLVSQFVFDGMSVYYFWDERVHGRAPRATDTDAKRYFRSLLHPIDTRNGWSWITDDVDALLRNFAGESARAFGFVPITIHFQSTGRFEGFVRYVYPGTAAEKAGIVRGDIIIAVNGVPLNDSNRHLMFDADAKTTFTVLNQHRQNRREVTITPVSFSANPVLHSSVHRIDGRVIGYLFYTAFRSNFNESLFEAFRKFQQENVTDLVLDLRYNLGGDLSAALYLASMIAPRTEVESGAIFTTLEFNQLINNRFSREGRNRRLSAYCDDFSNPIDANLNINRVHIIATRHSASASELTIFCLRPFMGENNVVHIGENTSGKYTVSWTVHAFDNLEGRAQRVRDPSRFTAAEQEELRNWAMQPIVGQYTDRNGRDFIAEGTLRPDVPVQSQIFTPELWKPIGDENDYLFSKAISLITGRPHTTATRSASDRQLIGTPLLSPQETLLRRAVNVDNMEIEPEMWQKMLESLR